MNSIVHPRIVIASKDAIVVDIDTSKGYPKKSDSHNYEWPENEIENQISFLFFCEMHLSLNLNIGLRLL